MSVRIDALRDAFSAKRVLKVIAGIANFDVEHVLSVARGASYGSANAVDVAARPDIIRAVRQVTNAAVFASCVRPENLAAAVAEGADVVELGNFDALYANGLFLGAEEVLALAGQTLALVDGRALVSVTIPGHLALTTQVDMACRLEVMGVDILQTEGAARALSSKPEIKPLSMSEKAAVSLHNTAILAKYTRLPVIAASGITVDNLEKAFAVGAAGVGVGTAINKLSCEAEMAVAVSEMTARIRQIGQNAASSVSLAS